MHDAPIIIIFPKIRISIYNTQRNTKKKEIHKQKCFNLNIRLTDPYLESSFDQSRNVNVSSNGKGN